MNTRGNEIKNEDFDQSTYLRLLKSYSDKISKHFIYLPIYFFIKCKIFTIFHILFQLRRCCWKRTRKDFMAVKLVVTNPGNTLTSVGILNPAMSILKSPAFSVTLYLKPIVLIGNMWNGTIQQKYYLSTGNLGNDKLKKKSLPWLYPSSVKNKDIKKINVNLWWINENLNITFLN